MVSRRTLLLTAPSLALLAGCSDGGDAAGSANGATLDVDGFASRAGTSGTVVLDVRTPQEYAEGHLEGAQNVDVSAPDFVDRISGLDHAAPYAVYCRSGSRSAEAMRLMLADGFTDVAHLDGGISAWTAAGRPVVR